MSKINKATRESRTKEFCEITSASPSEAVRFLSAHSYQLESSLDAFFSDPNAMRLAESGGKSTANTGKNLEAMWNKYKG